MRPSENAAETAEQFYNAALEVLLATGQPFLVGGGYVMREYADVNRETKDLDVFCRPSDSLRLLGALKSAGYETMVEDPDWIAKAFQADFRVDLIFGAANRLHRVDDTWFTNAPTIELHGHQVKLVSAEDTIWSKAYVQERDRFDGADINHIIRKSGPKLDWRRLLVEAGLRLLEDGPTEVAGVGFAGAKGFCGGFDKHMLQPWGERTIKQFVADAVAESMHLESALAKLRMERKLAVLHYAPVKGTVEGEPLEIYPYLGSSRMAEPLDHFGVSAVVHGHAHGGSPEARTARGIPVYNVALPLLRKLHPQQPFLVLTL
jgi:hypothetical protein